MQEPTLVIMAAGMGSRFGGLKQITPVDDQGHAIIDYSLYDARRAGFKKVIFIIKKEIYAPFHAHIGSRMEPFFDVQYVYQQQEDLPEGYTVPEGREKPWGTGHAVARLHETIETPFAVLNADDYYGPSAFQVMYDFLSADRAENEYAMVAYLLRNTVTDSGSVSRGVCEVQDGFLKDVTEHLKIFKDGDNAISELPDGTRVPLSGDCPISMNFWGFGRPFPSILWDRFSSFLDETLPTNPLKGEFLLPNEAGRLLEAGACTVQLLPCHERWYGMTYREDLEIVRNALAACRETGLYPKLLWE